MDLYFGGAEIPGWRTLLADEGVEHVALSYMGLRRRTKFSRPWTLAEKFGPEQDVFLDSGAYTINNADEEKYSVRDLKDIAAHYMSFVAQNIDRVAMVSEFDATVLGKDWIEAAREDFWDDLGEKFLPIWHGDSVEELDRLCQRYERVGVPQTALGGRNLTPTLNGIVGRYGTKLHGVAMTKPDEMAAVKWDSVASTSWISPSQYGDTIVWTGKELKRYPKKYKDQARKRHRTLFNDNGFDAAAIEADDNKEVLRLSIWSWRQQVAHIDRHDSDAEVVSTLVNPVTGEIAELDGDGVDTQPSERGNSGALVPTRVQRELINLPVMGILTSTETVVGPDGSSEEQDVPLVQMRSDSMRMCNSCFLKDKCPAFVPEANCAYNIPVVLKTKDQYRALQDALIEMQTQRVLFMRMAEDMEGGYADPNLSNEVDRLQKLIKTKQELEQDQFSIKFEAKGSSGQAGMISRLFGRDAGETASALPAPISADLAIEQGGIIDAEIVDLPSPSQR